jgi:hypothetical protein
MSSSTICPPTTRPRHVAQALSQIEIWFLVLTSMSLNGASLTSVKEFVAHIGGNNELLPPHSDFFH